jgi:two-component system, OmpR family, sensor histidine kinase KdpD
MAFELAFPADRALAAESASPEVVLAAAAHELRLPLSHIKGFVSSLRRTDITWDTKTTGEFLQEIELEADRLGELINALLSKGAGDRRGYVTRELRPTTPAHLVQSALRRAHLILQDRRVEVDVPQWLPPFRMDRDGMERVLTNLLENAVKYSPGDTPIEVSAQVVDGGDLEIVVADRGVGVAPVDRARVFQPFYRSETRMPGHGLGLTIALSIVRAHGGQIQLIGRRGGGTRVSVRIPKNIHTGSAATDRSP